MAPRYDQPERGPEKLSEILAKLFVARGWGQRTARRELDDAWMAVVAGVVSEAAARRTMPGNPRRGTLEVVVDGAALLAELSSFHKDALLAGLNERLKGTRITALRFRAGKISAGKGPADNKGDAR